MKLKILFYFLLFFISQSIWSQVSFKQTSFDLGTIKLANEDIIELNIINKTGEVVYLLNFQAQPNISIKYSSKEIGIGEVAYIRFKLNPKQKGNLSEQINLNLSNNSEPIKLTFNAKVKTIPKNDNQDCPDFSSKTRSKNGYFNAPNRGKINYFFLELLPENELIADTNEETFIEEVESLEEATDTDEELSSETEPEKTLFQQLFGKETTGKEGTLLSENSLPNNIVFLIDASTSMEKEKRMDLLKATMIDLLSILREEDYLSIVIYSGNARTILQPTSGIRKEEIKAIIKSIKADGNTQAAKGIDMAIEIGQSAYIDGGINQIILATDGDFELGKYNTLLRERIEKNASEGLTISTLGIKNERWTAASLKEISKLGSGNYFRIKSKKEISLLSEEVKAKSSAN